MTKEIHDINTRALDFVVELIEYIFEYPDDDYMSMECLCRKLHRHGLVDKKDGFYLVADDTLRKTENSSEKPNNSKDEPQTEVKVEPTWVGVTYGRFEDEPQIDGAIDEARFKAHCMNCRRDVADIKCLDCDGDKYFIADEPQERSK